MKNNLLITIIYSFFLSGCNTSDTTLTTEVDSTKFIKTWLMETEFCSKLSLDRKMLPDQYENATNCYIETLYQSSGLDRRDDIVNFVSERILSLELPEHLLTKMLKATVNGSSSYTKLIKILVDKGASTRSISIDSISNHNDVICKPIEYILEKNEKLYRENLVFSEDNTVDASDIFPLVNTYVADHYVCVNAIEKLISYYPDAINLNSNGIPLKHLLQNPEPAKVPPLLAVKLLSKANVNLIDGYGDTAIHTYLLGNQHRGVESLRKYQNVIDKFIELGGNLDLKNKKGITVRELLSSNSLL